MRNFAKNFARLHYRKVALRSRLRIRAYERATAITSLDGPAGDGFMLTTCDRNGRERQVLARHIVIATGYFDQPNRLGIPGEDSSKVQHLFKEAHPYTGMRVAIIGGSNSAMDAALELERAGAAVTVLYRGAGYSASIKPWVRPVVESKVARGTIALLFEAQVTEIHPQFLHYRQQEQLHRLDNDFVLILTGFHPDRTFLTAAGVTLAEAGYPNFDPHTMETNVPGIYLAGVVASRHEANEVFIETGRFHGRHIAEHLVATGRI